MSENKSWAEVAADRHSRIRELESQLRVAVETLEAFASSADKTSDLEGFIGMHQAAAKYALAKISEIGKQK